MEIKPKMTLKNMIKQASGQKLPTHKYIDSVMDWYDDKLWIFNCTGTAKAKRIIEVFEYAYKRYGIKWFVIDSFMKCGIAEDDYSGQKDFVEALADFKNEFDVFILLLVHPRKSENESKPLGKMDIKGTGAISDLADTILTVWRNKFKEDLCAKADAGETLDPQYADIADSPDAICKCVKQRNHDEGKEPTLQLWFDNKNLQYHAGPRANKFEFVRYSGPVEAAA
jgi:twinkle protein